MTVNVRYLMQLREVKGNLNLYDIKAIRCEIYQKEIGEVDFDAEIIHSKCGQCANPISDNMDKIPFLIYHLTFSSTKSFAKPLISNHI